MPQIIISDLTFAYPGSFDNIFENVSFIIDTGWKLGFTGRNGRGKTTFLNLLRGMHEYKGSIRSPVAFDYFPYAVPDETLDARDVAMNISPSVLEWELVRELNKLDIDEGILYRPFNTLSYGERTKLMLAAMFLRENNFLLIDEPTNHLDLKGRETVSRYLNTKRGFIIVSHDRAFLDNCTDHTLSINKTDIEIRKGNFSSYLENKEKQDSFELDTNEKLKKDIARLENAARRASHWSDEVERSKIGSHAADRGFIGHKAAKMMKSAKNIEQRRNRATEEKSTLLKNIETTFSLKMQPLDYHSDLLISAAKLNIAYGGRTVCDGISFDITRGSRIALTGGNGSGKSSICKLIAGEDIPYTGDLRVGSRLKISYAAQSTAGLSGSLPDYAEAHGIDATLFMAILNKLYFSKIQFGKDISGFSEGQKKKVMLARSLCEKAHLYIWDEPLNYIDIYSRLQIEQLILDSAPTILFVEHDRAFTDKIATGIITL